MDRFENKYDLLNEAYKDVSINKGTLQLFQYLVYKSNDAGCFPSVDTIAKALSCCRRTVQNNMRKLEKAGYIIRKDRWYNHQQLSNSYLFNLGVKEEKKISWKKCSNNSVCGNFDDNTLLKNGFYKSHVISWVFTQELSTKEKLLMIYCIHRANQAGIMYGSIHRFCKDLGICERTLYSTLISLREKGILRIKNCSLKGKRGFAVQMTGEIHYNQHINYDKAAQTDDALDKQNKETFTRSEFVQKIQNLSVDRRLHEADQRIYIVHNKQMKKSHIYKIQDICEALLHMADKLYNITKSGVGKIRKILRI